VNLYNRSSSERSLEGFIVHMNLAWLYLLHARFERDHIDYRYWEGNRLNRVDGEPKTWGLKRCWREEYPDACTLLVSSILVSPAPKSDLTLGGGYTTELGERSRVAKTLLTASSKGFRVALVILTSRGKSDRRNRKRPSSRRCPIRDSLAGSTLL
jgi:hypothetical protein